MTFLRGISLCHYQVQLEPIELEVTIMQFKKKKKEREMVYERKYKKETKNKK